MADTVLTYEYDSTDGTYVVTGADSIADDGKIGIPDKWNGPEGERDVRKIAPYAFQNNFKIKQVTGCIEHIGDYAFSNNGSLTSVNFESYLKSIGNYAFQGSDMLSNISGHNALERIGKYAFAGCIGLQTIEISGTASIGDYAFKGCTNLENIALSDDVKQVAENSFEGTKCYNDVNNWADGGFYIGTHLICGSSKESLTSIRSNTKIISGKFTSTGENIKIPDGVTYIAKRAFENCQDIKELAIGEEVEQIYSNTFKGLPNLEKIVFKATNVTCDGAAFEGMGSQSKKVEIIIAKNVSQIPNDIFKQIEASDVETVLTFENEHKCTSIGKNAFAKCGFKELMLVGNIQTIDKYAFSECKSLESVVISCPSIVINQSAFAYCTSLNDLQLNEGVTKIQGQAFEECAIKEIHIPNSTQEIDDYAFFGCREIEKISTGNGVTDITFIQRAGATSNFTHLVIGDNVVEPKFTIRKNSLEEVTIGKKYQVCDIMFGGCSGLKKVVLKEGLKKIGFNAFSDCVALSEITLPNGLEEIGNNAFINCGALRELTIPTSVKTIGTHAFQNCTGLKNIGLPEAKYSIIPEYAFYGCVLLKTIIIPKNVDTIGKSAFYGCASITDVTISEGTKIIEQEAFYNCSSLENLVCPNSLTYIGRQALRYCNKLNTVDYQGSEYLGNLNNNYIVLLKTADSNKTAIHPATKILYDESLLGKKLTKLTIPPTVTCVGYMACGHNGWLQRVDIEAKNAVIDSLAFVGCNGLAFYSIQPWSPSLQYYGATDSSYTFIGMPYLDMDYLGFTFNGKHSYLDLKALRTSDGDRYNINLTPETTDLTAENPSADGAYYFNSYHKQKKFNLNLAFERITDKDLREWKRFCSYKGLGDLIFDEEPYKVYTAKITGQPSLRAIPFDDGEERVYRGEIGLEFTCYWPYAHTPDVNTATSSKKVEGGKFARDGRIFNSYIDYNRNLWKETSGLLNTAGSGENPGDIPAPFILTIDEAAEGTEFAITQDLSITTLSTVYKLEWNSKTGVVSGLLSSTAAESTRKPVPVSGNTVGGIPVGGCDLTSLPSGTTVTYHYWYY